MKERSFTIDVGQEGSAAAEKLRRKGESPRVVDSAPRTADWRSGKRNLHLAGKRGDALHLCASMDPEYLCCSVHVLEAVSNCPFNCTYFFLQSYLNDTTMAVVVDTGALVAEVRAAIANEPGRFLRIGTWELGDSLALDPLTGTAAELVVAFADIEGALLELRTKSDCVDGLLGLSHKGRSVVGWTLNPQSVVASEELGTASVSRRLAAMAKVVAAGYLVSVHFDPIIIHDGWEGAYDELVEQLFAVVRADRIAWISMGALRFNPEMKKLIAANYPGSRITTPEMVLGNDGKVRYVKPLRLPLYERLLGAIRRCGGEGCFTYLCMERWDVWQRVLGYHPRSSAHLDYRMAESLHRRFPELVPDSPHLGSYGASDE